LLDVETGMGRGGSSEEQCMSTPLTMLMIILVILAIEVAVRIALGR
jgi:hypothetical protein